MFKKHRVVMLPTEKATNFPFIGVYHDNGRKLITYVNSNSTNSALTQPQHLYILSDEVYFSHKKGDWVYESDNTIPVYQFTYDICEYPLRRIIASTNPSLNLPSPSDSFIKKYCELGGIDEVIVEYKDYCETDKILLKEGYIDQSMYNSLSKLKVAPDNTITIKKVKDSWSKQEVIDLLQKLKYSIVSKEVCECGELHFNTLEMRKWIEENL